MTISGASKIISHFDEVILDKASKHSLIILEDKLKYYAKVVDLEILSRNQKDQHKTIVGSIDVLDSKVSKMYDELYTLYDTTMREMSPKIRGQVIEILRKRIVYKDDYNFDMNFKVNRVEFDKVANAKADKRDVKMHWETLSVYGSQLQHLCIVLTELLKNKLSGKF